MALRDCKCGTLLVSGPVFGGCILVKHGSADQTVSPDNAHALVDQWRGLHGLDGAPEVLRELCNRVRVGSVVVPLDDAHRKRIEGDVETLSDMALRPEYGLVHPQLVHGEGCTIGLSNWQATPLPDADGTEPRFPAHHHAVTAYLRINQT